MEKDFPDRRQLAAQVWRELFDLLIRTSPSRAKALAELGLTPNDARALNELDAEEGRSMQSLAERWGCDASNVTAIVDRLERLGLAERRTVPRDRRLRHVVLTRNGVKIRRDLQARMYQPPPEITSLDGESLEALAEALRPLRTDGEASEDSA